MGNTKYDRRRNTGTKTSCLGKAGNLPTDETSQLVKRREVLL